MPDPQLDHLHSSNRPVIDAAYNAAMDSKERSDTDGARTYAQRWSVAAAVLDERRLRDLRALTEVEAARRFALITTGVKVVPGRPTSGLVEQQRIFARLRR